MKLRAGGEYRIPYPTPGADNILDFGNGRPNRAAGVTGDGDSVTPRISINLSLTTECTIDQELVDAAPGIYCVCTHQAAAPFCVK